MFRQIIKVINKCEAVDVMSEGQGSTTRFSILFQIIYRISGFICEMPQTYFILTSPNLDLELKSRLDPKEEEELKSRSRSS